MNIIYKNCQSCGMSFNNDPRRGGTNSDGTKSHKYCSYCYDKGAFTRPDMTAAQMQQHVKGKLKELGGIHGLFAGFFSRNIPTLERWNPK